jgi:four helix bundle protein
VGRIRGDLLDRTLDLALSIVDMLTHLPQDNRGWVIGKQPVRSGTSIGANIREADAALTDAEFVQRCSVARKEASETYYRLLLCREANLLSSDFVDPALVEVDEVLRILASVVKKTQTYLQRKKSEG